MTYAITMPAIYANFFRVGHNASEFILDCCQAFENEEIFTTQRVVFTPASAHELHVILGNSLVQHARLMASRSDEAA